MAPAPPPPGAPPPPAAKRPCCALVRWLGRAAAAAALGAWVALCAAHARLVRFRWYGENGDLKILSLLIAGVIFHNVRADENNLTQKTLVLPVHVKTAQRARTVLGFHTADADGRGRRYSGDLFLLGSAADFINSDFKLPKEARVTFKGSPDAIRRLSAAPDACVVVDIPHIGADAPGIGMEHIGGGHVQGIDMRDLSVGAMEPPFVRYAWDKVVSIDVPAGGVNVPVSGRPSSGSRAQVEILAEKITLQGSELMFDRLREDEWRLSTEPVDVSLRSMTFIERLKVDVPADSGITAVIPPQINVRVWIRAARGSKGSISGPYTPVEEDGGPPGGAEGEGPGAEYEAVFTPQPDADAPATNASVSQ